VAGGAGVTQITRITNIRISAEERGAKLSKKLLNSALDPADKSHMARAFNAKYAVS
jgi:hypothetical protein